jgi:hypothetical protein
MNSQRIDAPQIYEATRRKKRAPENLCDQRCDHTQLRRHRDALSRPDQGNNPPQQLILNHGPIRYRQRIPLRNPLRVPRISLDGDHSMTAEPAVAPHHHDIADPDLVRANALDHQRVPWPNRRQHAPARRRETNRPEAAQNLARKLAFHGAPVIRHADLRLPHDAEEWTAHPLWVVVILPQESAEVTNTCSCRKPGFS